jgi:hypothetical protein
MIDPATEELLTLCQAAKLIPSARKGKKTSPSTLFRWTSRGLQGIRLETIKVGGARRTSKEALTRFYQALSIADGLNTGDAACLTPDRSTEIARAEARVKAQLG